jgi:TetR/AcrR family transcriptional regulator, transcriptional repressor for nem operon
MRYPPNHKHATRRRIVEVASLAFREHGVAETGVDEVMRRAGLTHGGFYAHFRDKSELIVEACAAAFDGALPNLERIGALPSRAARVRLLIDSYLAPRHRDNHGAGCVVVAVGADAARLKGEARTGYSRGLNLHLGRLGAALRLHDDETENHRRVSHLLCSLVGALLFARAIEDRAQSDDLLRVMRERLKAEFCGPHERTRPSPAVPTAQAPAPIESEAPRAEAAADEPLELHLR